MIVSGVPKAAEKAMEKFKEYVVCRAPIAYHKELSPSRTLRKEMKELEGLANKSQFLRILY